MSEKSPAGHFFPSQHGSRHDAAMREDKDQPHASFACDGLLANLRVLRFVAPMIGVSEDELGSNPR